MPEKSTSSNPLESKRTGENNRLMEQIAAPDNLLAAWRAVRGNIPRYRRMRSAGPDGITLDDFERELPVQLGALRSMLLHGRYQARPPALFKVQKRSGGERQLAVLTIADRVVQRAAQQAMEPLWEPSFLPCSFGFRPGLSIHHAVEQARSLRQTGNTWTVDGDISTCFDSLDPQILLHKVEARVQDHRVLELVNQWLDQGILEHGVPDGSKRRLSGGLGKVSGEIKKGANWVINTLSDSTEPSPYHPYGMAQPYPDDPYPLENPYLDGIEAGYLPLHQPDARQNALQQVFAGSLMLGASWVRPALTRLGTTVINGLRTPVGREVLKKSALAGGGVVGAALGVGAAAWLVYQELAPSPVGILQGSPLSPLLSNIYLHSFDLGMTRSGYHLVRYADDWLVCCPTEQAAERAYNQAVIALSKIRLKINPEKTRIRPPSEPMDWLGERIQPVHAAPDLGGWLRRVKR